MNIPIERKKKKKIMCALGVHSFEHMFVAYADQPFEDDPSACTEGYHTLACKRCGIERNMRVAGLLANTPFMRKHEKNFPKLKGVQQDFVFHTMYSSKFDSSRYFLQKEKGRLYVQRILLAKVFFFLPVYWFSPRK